MPRYAADTDVTSDRSRTEIERTLQRYGADQFMSGWDDHRAVIGFRMANRHVRFNLPLPDRADDEFTLTPTGRDRSPTQALNEWEKACRQRWRALALVVKAKLEAVEAGISEFDDEFMAHLVLPDGSTVGEFMRPQVCAAYENGAMPRSLPALEAGSR